MVAGLAAEPESLLHTDVVVEQVEEFHDNLKAALDWSLDEPAVGLELLGLLARPWQNTGRHGEAMAAVDRLLIEDTAAAFPQLWARAGISSIVLVGTARGMADSFAVLRTAQRLAAEVGDELLTATAEWFASAMSLESCATLRDVALRNGDRYRWALSVLEAAHTQALAATSRRPWPSSTTQSRPKRPVRAATCATWSPRCGPW